jgi:hypothetical protein
VATAGPSFDAFLSYHSGDSAWVARLKSALEQKGVRVWLDTEQLRPGDVFPRTLARAIGSVRCVVVVLSPGSLASAWVEEEYNLALAHRCHVVPILIAHAEPPGFLAGRSWVDFREESRFTAALEHLVFGITGMAGPAASDGDAPVYRDAAPDPAADEAAVLERLIARRRLDARRLWTARLISVTAGMAVGLAFLWIASALSVEIRLGVCVMAVIIVSLAGWAATATGLARLTRKVEQFEILRDGLEACRKRTHPGCTRLRQHFWDMMVRNAASAGLDVSHL